MESTIYGLYLRSDSKDTDKELGFVLFTAKLVFSVYLLFILSLSRDSSDEFVLVASILTSPIFTRFSLNERANKSVVIVGSQ